MDTRDPVIVKAISKLKQEIEEYMSELYDGTHSENSYDELYLKSESYGYAGEGYSEYEYDFKHKDCIYKEPPEDNNE